jgi:hypothetical protein
MKDDCGLACCGGSVSVPSKRCSLPDQVPSLKPGDASASASVPTGTYTGPVQKPGTPTPTVRRQDLLELGTLGDDQSQATEVWIEDGEALEDFASDPIGSRLKLLWASLLAIESPIGRQQGRNPAG